MHLMGGQFVMGRTIEEGLKHAAAFEAQGFRHSFDMLGEGAKTAADAARYLDHYRQAIAVLGHHAKPGDLLGSPGLSVKLSALHPRYEPAQRDRVQIGRAHVCTPVTNAQLVCRLLLEKNKKSTENQTTT